MAYIFSEFETLADKHYRIGLFFKPHKYIRPALEYIYLNPAVTLEDLANFLNLSEKKTMKLIENLAEKQILIYTIRNNDLYLNITYKGTDFLNFLEK